MRLSSILTRTKMSMFNILLSEKCSTNINQQQPTFKSVFCKLRNTAISMSTATKTRKSGKIRYLDSHKPSEPFCCWRRSHLRRLHSRTQRAYQEPSRSPLHWGKDETDNSDYPEFDFDTKTVTLNSGYGKDSKRG